MQQGGSATTGGRTRFITGLAVISALAALLALSAGPALAKRIVGTNGADTIVGTKKADRINARGGNDRVNARGGNDRVKGGKGKDRLKGGKGKDRLKGGKGKDRLKGDKGKDRLKGDKGKDGLRGGKGDDRLSAVDDRRDGAVNGGPGKDLCTIDQADLPVLAGCEQVEVKKGGGPGGGPRPNQLRVKDASGLSCGSPLPLCPFQIAGDRATALVGTVSGGGGVTVAAGAGVVIVGDTWTATGLYGCSDDGYLEVTIGSRSARVPINCSN